MTRPKVDPEKRQRTATACDSCKRRKQKCNGLQPCNTCFKRSASCTYGTAEDGGESGDPPSPKRRMIDSSFSSNTSPTQLDSSDSYFQKSQTIQWSPNQDSPARGSARLQQARRESDVSDFKIPPHSNSIFSLQQGVGETPGINIANPFSKRINGRSVNGENEEAVATNPRMSMRMLQDGKGRLLYLGDSASLSFLQLIRMNVESVAGESAFTQDPKRFWIVERTPTLPSNHLHTHLLPDKQTANVLVESFFTNGNGLIEVFQRNDFMRELGKCYDNPLSVEPDWLCLLYLTFAVGLVMAVPVPGSSEHTIVENLRGEKADRAEIFYSNAKRLADPTSGFEDAGFRSIQVLALMAVYTLATSRRNAAYAYFGMAVRSAFALGLHREETLSISLFTDVEQAERRNLWRTLYILDRIISTSLGRPTAIRESDSSGNILGVGTIRSVPLTPFPTRENAGTIAAPGLAAAIRSCHMIGVILERIYSQRKISTKIAQKIAEGCKGWPKNLDPSLRVDNLEGSSTNPAQGIAILHVNLLYHHSIVLLTRPFFIFLMTNKHEPDTSTKRNSRRAGNRMGEFARACVAASCESIKLVNQVFEAGFLPRSNPFVMYFLFSSAVVVLASEFAQLHTDFRGTDCIHEAILIMQYSAETDLQGERLLFILQAFRDVVVEERAKAAHAVQQMPIPSLSTSTTAPHVSTQDTTSPSPLESHRLNSEPSIIPPFPSTLEVPSISISVPPNPANSMEPPSRHNSLSTIADPMLELARGIGSGGAGSTDGSDSQDDAQIDFAGIWEQLDARSGNYMTESIGITPGGSIGVVQAEPLELVGGFGRVGR